MQNISNMEYEAICEMPSSRNLVTLVRLSDGRKAIFKRFRDPEGARRESDTLRRTAVTGYAPHVLEEGPSYLINEYVEGVTLYDEFRLATMTDDEALLTRLSELLGIYLQIFYSVNDGLILNDINLKNFIIKDGRCYGIDYENTKEGMQYRDAAGIIARAAVNATGGAYAAAPFIRGILKSFHLELFDVINEIREYFELYISRGAILDADELLNDLIAIFDSKMDAIRALAD